MKEEALKLDEELDALHQYVPSEAPAMIRRLVEELDKATYVIEPKQTKPTITKLDDKVVAVTMTDDDHRIAEVLWEAPKPLSDEEILKFIHEKFVMFGFEADYIVDDNELIEFARAIEERHGIK